MISGLMALYRAAPAPTGGVGVSGNGLLVFRVADIFGKNKVCWFCSKTGFTYKNITA